MSSSLRFMRAFFWLRASETERSLGLWMKALKQSMGSPMKPIPT
jgi:hypothetical protein